MLQKKWFVLLIPLLFFVPSIFNALESNLGILLVDDFINVLIISFILYLLVRKTEVKGVFDWIILFSFVAYFTFLYENTVSIKVAYMFRFDYLGHSNPNMILINLVPFQSIIETYNKHAMPIYQIVGNMLMLTPFAFATHYFGWIMTIKRTILYMFLLSVVIELFELFQTFIGSFFEMYPVSRSFDVDDIILNTFGAFIGIGCFQVWKMMESFFAKNKQYQQS